MVGPSVRARRAWIGLVAAGATLVATTAPADDVLPRRPGIVFQAGVPTDLQELARSTWTRFTDVFLARWSCLPAVHVTGAWQLPDRASYDSAHRLARVRIPGTAANLEAALVHEFAHHLEFACPEIGRLRPPFLSAQGFPPGADWFHGPTWEATPSEQFAESAVQVVLGRGPHLRVFATPEALRAIRAWGRGD